MTTLTFAPAAPKALPTQTTPVRAVAHLHNDPATGAQVPCFVGEVCDWDGTWGVEVVDDGAVTFELQEDIARFGF